MSSVVLLPFSAAQVLRFPPACYVQFFSSSAFSLSSERYSYKICMLMLLIACYS